MSERLPAAFLRSVVTPELKNLNEKAREVTHLITTGAVDRVGDIVDPAGADLANYMKNPVVLADHDYSIKSIIGRATSVSVDEGGIAASTKFADTPLGREAFNLVKEGMARAWSIGFHPIEYEGIKDEKGVLRGFHFKKWELLEYSLVAVPMNPDAVTNAVRRGVVSAENIGFFFKPERPDPSSDELAAEQPNDLKGKREYDDERMRLAQDMLKRARRIQWIIDQRS